MTATGILALLGPVGIPELLIIFFILVLIFGAKRLSGLGRGHGSGDSWVQGRDGGKRGSQRRGVEKGLAAATDRGDGRSSLPQAFIRPATPATLLRLGAVSLRVGDRGRTTCPLLSLLLLRYSQFLQRPDDVLPSRARLDPPVDAENISVAPDLESPTLCERPARPSPRLMVQDVRLGRLDRTPAFAKHLRNAPKDGELDGLEPYAEPRSMTRAGGKLA